MVNGLAFPLLAAAAFFRDISCPVYEHRLLLGRARQRPLFGGFERCGCRHTYINYELALWHLEGGTRPKRTRNPTNGLLQDVPGRF